MAFIITGSIIIAILLIILLILLLPVNLNIENISSGKLSVYVKILCFKIGEKKNKAKKKEKTTEDFLGIKSFSDLKKSFENGTLSKTVTKFSGALISVFKEIINLLKKCTVKKLYIKFINAGENAAEAAIGYGAACAAAYALEGYIEDAANVKKNAINLDFGCRYDTEESEFKYFIVISFRLYRILISLFKIAKKKAEREK